MHAQFDLTTLRREFESPEHRSPADDGLCEAFLRESFESAKEYLDFFPIVFYPAFFYRTPEGLNTETVGMKEHFKQDWTLICRLVKEYNEPGRFVTFPGYEWTGDRTAWGDHNVFYPYDDPTLDLSGTLEELYGNLRKAGGIAVPHHTAYAPGNRAKNWDYHDEELSPFAEIYSVHGSSEGCLTPIGMYRNGSMSPRVSGGSIQDGLARGYRLGLIASGDNGKGFAGKWGIGTMACQAEELTRNSLWEAFLARRVYAVTGDRIAVRFKANGSDMGSITHAASEVTLRAEVEGTTAVDRIEILRSNRVVHSYCHSGKWETDDKSPCRVKIAYEFGWGPSSRYCIKAGARQWLGTFRSPGSVILSAAGRFTRHGNRFFRTGDDLYEFHLTTDPRQNEAFDTVQQSLVFEVEGSPDGELILECSGRTMRTTLRNAQRETGLLVYLDDSRARIKEQFGLSEGDFENSADAYYHNAYKIKRHLAVPRSGYFVNMTWTDKNPLPGHSWYYLRVSQLNGQYAWTSPIWVQP